MWDEFILGFWGFSLILALFFVWLNNLMERSRR